MKITKYYDRSKRKWIVEVVDEVNNKHVAESHICNNKEAAETQEEKLNEKYGYSWFYHWTTEKIIKDILIDLGIDCGFKNVVLKQSKIMFYNHAENLIGFNNDYIVEFCMNNLIPIVDGVKCITYHEIGHWLEFKLYPELTGGLAEELKEDRGNYRIKREENAFKLARYLVPDDLIKLYEDINYTNLRNYEKKYKLLTM